jgi:hypothetical protein
VRGSVNQLTSPSARPTRPHAGSGRGHVRRLIHPRAFDRPATSPTLPFYWSVTAAIAAGGVLGEVLRLMATGLSNAEIATHLYVGMETVKTHVSNSS